MWTRGPPVLWLRGWMEDEPRGRLLCSVVLGKGQCTQLRSRGKCKTNMPCTCFLLSCHGSAFKDPPLLITHLNTHTLHCASPFAHFHHVHCTSTAPPASQGPTQEGFLINTEPCGGYGRQYCVSGQTGPSVLCLIDCSTAQCTQTCWNSVAQVYISHTHYFTLFYVSTLIYYWIETYLAMVSSSAPGITCPTIQ